MRLLREERRISYYTFSLLLAALLLSCHSKASFVDDEANVLSEAEEDHINNLNEALLRDIGVHIKVITLKDSPGDIDSVAAELFSKHRIGKRTGDAKGVLFLIDPEGRQVRVEVGYGLEHIFTDGFVGYIERRQMTPFFESGQVGPGIEATVELLVGRALGEVDDTPFEAAGTGEFLSGGAGARTNVEIGSGVPEKDQISMPEEFSPQPSPQAALESYRQSLIMHIKDPNLGIFTPDSRVFFGNWTVTDAQQDNALKSLEESLPHARTETDGDLAVILFPAEERQASPYFLVRGRDGWMLDFVFMNKVIGFNHKNQWFMRSTRHKYMFAFQDFIFDKNGFPHKK